MSSRGSSDKMSTDQLQEARAHYRPAPHKACWESTGIEKDPLAQKSYQRPFHSCMPIANTFLASLQAKSLPLL